MTTEFKPLNNAQSVALAWAIFGGLKAVIKGKDFWFSVVVTLVSFTHWSSNAWTGTVISVTPSLLGFTLSGFAIFLGFGSDGFKEFLSDSREHKSPYMSTSSAFLMFVVVQLISLIYALCAQAFYFPPPACLIPYQDAIRCLALVGGFTGYLLFIYGLMLSFRAGLRIFMLSRWLNFWSYKQSTSRAEAEADKQQSRF